MKFTDWKFVFGLVTIFIYFHLQSQYGGINPDIRFLLIGTERLITHGGSYAKDFFEVNPPLIIYLYWPIWAAHQYLNLSLATGIELYCLMLYASVIAGYCYFSEKPKVRDVLLFTFLLLVLPRHEELQREYLLVIFMLPYLFMTMSTRQSGFLLRITLTSCACLGYLIKPHFLIIPAVLEGSKLWDRRAEITLNPRTWLSLESIILIAMLVLYLGLITRFHSDYFTVVMSIVWHFYYAALHAPTIMLLTVPPATVSQLLFMLTPIWISYTHSRTHILMLWTLMLPTFIIFVAQRNMWWYHFYPCAFFTVWLIDMLLRETAYFSSSTKKQSAVYLGIFIYCANSMIFAYQFLYYRHSIYTRLAQLIEQLPLHSPIYSLGNLTDITLFLNDQFNAPYPSRFNNSFWLGGHAKKIIDDPYEKKLLIDLEHMMVEDIKRYQPNLLLIDTSHKYTIYYPDYLASHPKLNVMFKDFHKIGSFEECLDGETTCEEPFKNFDIYARNPEVTSLPHVG